MQIVGITGTNGAGKGAIVEYLISKGFKHFSVSSYLKEELTKKKVEINRTNLQDIGNKIREEKGAEYIVSKLYKKAKTSKSDSIIESIRNPKEAEFIKRNGGIILAVTASQKVRYQRIKKTCIR